MSPITALFDTVYVVSPRGRIAEMDGDTLPLAYDVTDASSRPDVLERLRSIPGGWLRGGHGQPREYFLANMELGVAVEDSEMALRCPTYVLLARDDRMVDNQKTLEKFSRNPCLKIEMLPGEHALFFEDLVAVAARLCNWITR